MIIASSKRMQNSKHIHHSPTPAREDTNCAKTTTRENNDNEPGRQQENPTLISLLCLGAIMGY